MHLYDVLVLAAYSVLMIGIGIYSSLKVKGQEDFFMGGRGFGKLLQTFAAFGAGTGSSDPVNTARTTFTSGMSGMWSVMYWLFVTPFYWIAGVWYRRMRHLTLGDWFVERYESKAMGAAYAVFGILFMIVYGSMLFSAIGKVTAPIIQTSTFPWMGAEYGIEYLLVPIIGVVVLIYGIAGGLRAAYFTDLIQGICIILLSIILIPYGLEALVEKFGDGNEGLLAGFRIMHEQVPSDRFAVVGATSSSEFPLHRIVAVVVINLIGVVVQPHFIATGGGSAKTEMTARVGLVVGNFLKRFCTVGWVLTTLIAVALFSDHPELVADPDRTWGVASRELLGPGLTGLMLACLLAALMSSIDAYMVVGSGLVVRNIYAAYINPQATDKQCVRAARLTGVIIVGGAVFVSLRMMDVFAQLQLTWTVPVLFAAVFWVGMFWRRATTTGAWTTIVFCALVFFVLPALLPNAMSGLRTTPAYVTTNEVVITHKTRPAAPSDVARRRVQGELWESGRQEAEAEADAGPRADALAKLGERPQPLSPGESLVETTTTGGRSIFWSEGVHPVDSEGNRLSGVVRKPVGQPRRIDTNTEQVVMAYDEGVRLQGYGDFRLDFLLYHWLGVDLTTVSNALLSTLELPPKIFTPFLVLILVSLFTRRNSKEALDRYYAKMKTPVVPDPEVDRQNLNAAAQDLDLLEKQKLFPGTELEFQKPTAIDIVGFLLSVVTCIAVVALAVWVVGIGS